MPRVNTSITVFLAAGSTITAILHFQLAVQYAVQTYSGLYGFEKKRCLSFFKIRGVARDEKIEFFKFFLVSDGFSVYCKLSIIEKFTMHHSVSAVIATTIVFLLIMASNSAFAVNFYDGARAKQGLYFLTYSSVYLADVMKDAKGDTKKSDYGLTKAEELLRFCYYTPDFVATALVPVGYADVRSLSQQSFGLGDINLGAGHFLPIKQVDILPMLFVKLPTGEYNSSKSVNVGSNQYDIKPMIFLYKAMGDFSIDAAAKYYFRQKNSSTDVSPGDEIYLQCLLGYNVTDRLKLGPSVNWMLSTEKKQGGVTISDSARETLSMGVDIYYRFAKISATLTYLYDVHTKNSPQGHFFQIKTVYLF